VTVTLLSAFMFVVVHIGAGLLGLFTYFCVHCAFDAIDSRVSGAASWRFALGMIALLIVLWTAYIYVLQFAPAGMWTVFTLLKAIVSE